MKSLTEFTLKKKQEGLKVLVAYVTAGLPGWIEAIHAAQENGADIIEIGLPFSDPIMDGPVIAEASSIALQKGAKTLNLLQEIKEANFSKPIAAMTYTNVLYSHGVKEIVQKISEVGLSGLILPDLTFEQSALFADELSDTDISLIQLISSTTNNERRDQIMKSSEGFLYCVAIKGITGQSVDLSPEFTQFIEPIQKQSPIPTYCGVGVRTAKDAQALSAVCDGVIVGTSIVEKMIANENSANEVGDFVGSLRSAIDGK